MFFFADAILGTDGLSRSDVWGTVPVTRGPAGPEPAKIARRSLRILGRDRG
jgi:hypothetical protein